MGPVNKDTQQLYTVGGVKHCCDTNTRLVIKTDRQQHWRPLQQHINRPDVNERRVQLYKDKRNLITMWPR